MSTETSRHHDAAERAIDLKADSFTLPVLSMRLGDMDAIAADLEGKVVQAPQFFTNTPVIIDLAELNRSSGSIEIPLLVGILRGFGMVPMGVRGGSEAQQEAAEAMELAVFSDRAIRHAEPVNEPVSEPAPAPKPARRERSPQARIVTRPVRSGQRIYASGGDLVILSQVGSGAEVMADGHIHIYGALRGRALAGVKGNREARVFCHALHPELVAIAGRYIVSENIDPALVGQPAQVSLQEKRLLIETLPTV